MLIKDIINETASAGSTGAGSVAAVNTPIGGIIKRPNPSIYSKKKKKKAEEGKSPHKKGTKKYKKHMAAMHAG